MSPPRHAAPARKRSSGLRLLGILGRLIALAGTVALAIQFGPRGLAAGILFGFVLPWLVALRPGRTLRRDPFRKGNTRLSWRPQVRPWAIVCGLAAGLGTAIVLQQYSVSAMTTALLVKGLIGGLLGGLVLPSLTWAFTVRRVNRRLAAAPAAAATLSLLWALVPLVLVLVSPAAAFAETDGPCTGTFAGLDVTAHDSLNEDEAILLAPEDHVTFALTAPAAPTGAEFRLHYGPAWVPIDEQPSGGSTVTASALVDDYDWVGAGLYRITAEATLPGGSTCSGAVLVDIGVDPLETVLGALGLTMAIAGSLGVAGTALHDSADAGAAVKRGGGAPPLPPGPAAVGGAGMGTTSALAYRAAGEAEMEPQRTASGGAGPAGEPLTTAAALDMAFGKDEPAAFPPAAPVESAARDVGTGAGVGAAAGLASSGRGGPDDRDDDRERDEWEGRPGTGEASSFEWPEDAGRAEDGRGEAGPAEAGQGDAARPGDRPSAAEVGQEMAETLTNPESFEGEVPPRDEEDEDEPDVPPRPDAPLLP